MDGQVCRYVEEKIHCARIHRVDERMDGKILTQIV